MKRRFCLAVLVTVLVLMGGESYAQECQRMGEGDCKPSSQPGVCYRWECQQTGALIYAQAQCPEEKLIQDVEECALAVQLNFNFNAYVSPDCKVHVKGDPRQKNRSYFEFDRCMSKKGQPIKSWERE
ncbi:MAG: hypothetical protein NT047_07390 [Deltaproteobacteria bacterium]|nr:hypothetical protein [Deltaproteobacteria bacterium]